MPTTSSNYETEHESTNILCSMWKHVGTVDLSKAMRGRHNVAPAPLDKDTFSLTSP